MYVSNYVWGFIHITQWDNNRACIPASFAMIIRYLDNIGKVNLTYTGSNSEMKEELYQACKYPALNTAPNPNDVIAVTEGSARTGLINWTSANCSHYYFTIQPGKYGNNTASNFSILKGEIDTDYPAVLMFDSNTIVGGDVSHATCMFGYKIDGNTKYIVVSDPWERVGGTKTMVWNNDVYGFFVVQRNPK